MNSVDDLKELVARLAVQVDAKEVTIKWALYEVAAQCLEYAQTVVRKG